MDSSQVVDIWNLFKEHTDKKHLETLAERFVDLLADYGVGDDALKDSIGNCDFLDSAINYYLDIDEELVSDDDDWD
jgi:hypothetical protein